LVDVARISNRWITKIPASGCRERHCDFGIANAGVDREEGRTYEISPGTVVRILPTDVPMAIEASLRKNGRKRTETQLS
jgi:hypothetical protein